MRGEVEFLVSVPRAFAERLRAVAARSGLTVGAWLRSSTLNSVLVDELHWRELDDREDLTDALARDRDRFKRVSRSTFGGMTDREFNLLVMEMVKERLKGREEGAESVARLVAVKARKNVAVEARKRRKR